VTHGPCGANGSDLEAGEEELALMTKIVDKMTKYLDLRAYHDGYKERIEALIKGAVAQVKEERPKNPVAKSMKRKSWLIRAYVRKSHPTHVNTVARSLCFDGGRICSLGVY